MMKNLLQRVAVGAVGIPAAIGAIWAGGWVFGVVVIAITSIALWEFYRLAGSKEAAANVGLGIGWSIALQLTLVLFTQSFHNPYQWFGAAHLIFLGGVMAVLTAELWRARPNALVNTGLTIAGVAYVTIFMSTLIILRNSDDRWFSSWFSDKGSALVLILFVSIWLCDTAAYFVGMNFGKHKLFPRVSPKKSWEGAIGGGITAVASFVGFSMWMMPEFPLIHAVACGLIVGVMGQIGDLAESLLKRDATIKDSSHILPGHGGLLDRFDSMLFASPLVLCYIHIVTLLIPR